MTQLIFIPTTPTYFLWVYCLKYLSTPTISYSEHVTFPPESPTFNSSGLELNGAQKVLGERLYSYEPEK